MFITDFIAEKYPIQNKIKELMSDPYQVIANEDGLPYDVIGPDEDGHVTKLIRVNEENRMISVMDLLSLSEQELEGDLELKNIHDIYMSQVTIEDINLADITKMSQTYKSIKKKNEEAAGVLSL